jgi:hypothetical protein
MMLRKTSIVLRCGNVFSLFRDGPPQWGRTQVYWTRSEGKEMTRSGLINVLLLAVLMGGLIALTSGTVGAVEAQKVNFSLIAGESVTVGDYTLQFRGLTGSFPAYDLYYLTLGGELLAHFPSDPPPPNWSEYVYENVSIVTTTVTPDGMAVTGTITVK